VKDYAPTAPNINIIRDEEGALLMKISKAWKDSVSQL
jgi:hypothetical protein